MKMLPWHFFHFIHKTNSKQQENIDSVSSGQRLREVEAAKIIELIILLHITMIVYLL